MTRLGLQPPCPLSLLFGPGLFLILCFSQTPWNPGTDMWWHELVSGASTECEPEWCDSEDKLFILYTSGSTGKPKVCLACNAELQQPLGAGKQRGVCRGAPVGRGAVEGLCWLSCSAALGAQGTSGAQLGPRGWGPWWSSP